MTKQKVSDFLFNGKSTVILQFSTLAVLLGMSWKISEWKSDIEHQLGTATGNRWTSSHMVDWTGSLALNNPSVIVPDIWAVIEHRRALELDE